MLKRLYQFIARSDTEKSLPFYQPGFHGDSHLLQFVNSILSTVEVFVETGTYVGETAFYAAQRHSHLSVMTCEPSSKRFAQAVKHLQPFQDRVIALNMKSPDFIYYIFDKYPAIFNSPVLFWLDAHGYGYNWPLHDELRLITSSIPSAVVGIDDFKVPNRPDFKFDNYNNQSCDLEYFTSSVDQAREYQLALPAYQEHTSSYHPLVGHVFFAYGEMVEYLPTSSDYTRISVNFSESRN